MTASERGFLTTGLALVGAFLTTECKAKLGNLRWLEVRCRGGGFAFTDEGLVILQLPGVAATPKPQ